MIQLTTSEANTSTLSFDYRDFSQLWCQKLLLKRNTHNFEAHLEILLVSEIRYKKLKIEEVELFFLITSSLMQY